MYHDSVEKLRGLKTAISSYRTSIASPSPQNSSHQRASSSRKSHHSSPSKHGKRTNTNDIIYDSDSLDEDDINKRKYSHARHSEMRLSELEDENQKYGVLAIPQKKGIQEIIADLPNQLSTRSSNSESLKNRKLTIILEENFDQPTKTSSSQISPRKTENTIKHPRNPKVRVVDSDEETEETDSIDTDSDLDEDMPKIVLSDSDDEIFKPKRKNYHINKTSARTKEYQPNLTRRYQPASYNYNLGNNYHSPTSWKPAKPTHNYAETATQHMSPIKKHKKRIPKDIQKALSIFDEEESDFDLPPSPAQKAIKPTVSLSKPLSVSSNTAKPNKTMPVPEAKQASKAKEEFTMQSTGSQKGVSLGNPDYHWWDNEKNPKPPKKLSPSKAVDFEKKYKHRAEMKADEIYEYFANLDVYLSDDDESDEPIFVPPRPDQRPVVQEEEEPPKVEVVDDDDYEEEEEEKVTEKVTFEEEEEKGEEEEPHEKEEEPAKIEPIELKGEAAVHSMSLSKMKEIRDMMKAKRAQEENNSTHQDEADSLILPKYDDIDVEEEDII